MDPSFDFDLDDPETIRVFVDGSCDNRKGAQNGTGGWAFSARFRKQRATRYGYAGGVTNNAMELEAIRRALLFIPASRKATRPLAIFCDSAYAISALDKWHVAWAASGWRTSNGSRVANKKLIRSILRLLAHHRRFRPVRFVKVKGHSGVAGNEHVDALAGTARKQKRSNWKKADIRNWPEDDEGRC